MEMIVFKILDKLIQFLGKIALFFLVGIAVIYIGFVAFVYAATWLWPDFYGSYSLGNNYYMLVEDKGRKTIVYGTSIEGNTCYSGEPVIPTYENQYDSLGNFAEYVFDAKSDDNWIIAKTNNFINNQRKYYILNKKNNSNVMSVEYIINTRVEVFTDSSEFAKKCHDYDILIKW